MATTINNVPGYSDTDTVLAISTFGSDDPVKGEVWIHDASGEKMYVIVNNSGTSLTVTRNLKDDAAALLHGDTLTKYEPYIELSDDMESDTNSKYTKVINGTGTITINDSSDGHQKHKHTAGANGQMAHRNDIQFTADWEILRWHVIQREVTAAGYQSVGGFIFDEVAGGFMNELQNVSGIDDAYLVDMSPATDFGFDHLHRFLAGVKLEIDTIKMKVAGDHPTEMLLVKTSTAVKVFTYRSDVQRMFYEDTSAERLTGPAWLTMGAPHTNGSVHIYFSEMDAQQWGAPASGGSGPGHLGKRFGMAKRGLRMLSPSF